MAYPCGGENNNEFVAETIEENTGIKLARTIKSSYSFDLQDNLLRFNPTIHFKDARALELAKQFIELETDKPQLFYIWGHTYEFDAIEDGWARFEELCRLISGKEDIFYGTNGEVFEVE